MSADRRQLIVQLTPEIYTRLQSSAKSAGLKPEECAERCIGDFLDVSRQLFQAIQRMDAIEKHVIEIAGFIGEIRAAVDTLE